MKTLIALILSIVVYQSNAFAYQSETAYMACSILDEENRVVLLAIPYSTEPVFGEEKQIAIRSCDSHFVRIPDGWATEFDCSKEIVMMKTILRQLQKSKICPNTDM